MASLEVTGFEDLQDAFRRISEIPWPVTAEALDGMAEVAMTEIRAEGERMGVRDPESDVHILDKLVRRKAKKTDSGGYEDVNFSGSRVRNDTRTRNAVIAFENEYGNRRQSARPFVGTALAREEDEIAEGGESILDWIEEEFNA